MLTPRILINLHHYRRKLPPPAPPLLTLSFHFSKHETDTSINNETVGHHLRSALPPASAPLLSHRYSLLHDPAHLWGKLDSCVQRHVKGRALRRTFPCQVTLETEQDAGWEGGGAVA